MNRNLNINDFSDKSQIQKKLGKKLDITEINSFSIDFRCAFDFVQISIMRASDILAVSNGEITKTDTLNYRSLKAEDDGIFCYKIFGSDKDMMCVCGRYSGVIHKGYRCERCGVVINPKIVRRFNFGHINLHTHVIHPWFYQHACILLNMTKRMLMSIINYDIYIFIKDSYDGKYKANNVVKTVDYYSHFIGYDGIMSGGDAVRELLSKVDVQAEYKQILDSTNKKHISDISEKDIKRRNVFKSVVENNINPVDLAISIIPVIPAALRPITYLEGGGVATMDINEQYRKIVSRKNRLQKLKEMETHDVIINNEKYMINQAVCNLIGPHKNKTSKSIAEYIKGKKGYFRRALLGKRTDFSGRSAIVCGPELPLDTCSIPIYIALDIFKPFIYSVLIRRNVAYNILDAKNILESRAPIVYSILHEIIQDFPIILNRAPTLHRLGIQAFKIKLTNTNAIRIPPLVCAPYNADFDGDQMSCHLPISIPSRVECYGIMLSKHNMFLPGSGKIAIMPSKDIIVGLYYMTICSQNSYEHNIYNIQDAYMIYENGYINENTCIKVKIKDVRGSRYVNTTYGRILLWSKLDSIELDFDKFNVDSNKQNISNYINYVFETLGQQPTLSFLNDITQLGFYYFTISGISYCPGDLISITTDKFKKTLDNNLEILNEYYSEGNMTNEEYNNNYISEWSSYIDSTSDQILDDLKNDVNSHDDLNSIPYNNIYLMCVSGARGSKSQIHQVLCLRGLISKPDGDISKFIIKSSLSEGLNISEYFESTHGERKCLSDVAIKTSRAGHFTRRLVDVAHRVFVCLDKCDTNRYMTVNKFKDKRMYSMNIEDAIYGHVLYEDLLDENNNILIRKDTNICRNEIDIIMKNEVYDIKIYSPVYCKVSNGVCQRCYGIDLSTHKLVDIGTLVGIIAAQSIGEPGTQLTMRTTHTGGIAQTNSTEETIFASYKSIVKLDDLKYEVNSDNIKVVILDSKMKFVSQSGSIIEDITLKIGSVVVKNNGDSVEENEMVAYYDKSIRQIICVTSGTVEYVNIIKNTVIEQDSDSSIARRRVSYNSLYSQSVPLIRIWYNKESYNEYVLENGMIVVCQDNKSIRAGDVIAKVFISSTKVSDITGGLPRVIDLFEVKKHVNKCIMSTSSGLVKISNKKIARKTKVVFILNDEGETICKYNVPADKHINVQDGMYIQKGHIIVNGEIQIQDLMDSMGIDCMIKYLIGQISATYEDQGVNINAKHISIIIKQMIKYVVVSKTVDEFLVGEMYEQHYIEEVNKQRIADSKELISFNNIIMGITKVAMKNQFISSSSFQHTISCLANAAIDKSIDRLEGIKERVIFGKFIPAGTGYSDFSVDKIRDDIKCKKENKNKEVLF